MPSLRGLDLNQRPLGYESGGLVPCGPSGAVSCRPVRAWCRWGPARAAEVRVVRLQIVCTKASKVTRMRSQKPRSLPASIAVGTLSGFDPRSEAGSTCVSVVRGRARQASVANCDDPEGDDGPTESLELQFVHWLGHDATLDGRVGSLAEQDLAGSSRIAEPGG
jgi:hypothetical protein